MTHQSSDAYVTGSADAGRQIAQLRHVLALVREMAEGPQPASSDAMLDEDARISSAYSDAYAIVRRRFDALAAETAAWAAAGVRALLAAKELGRPTAGAARQLASDLDRALRTLRNLVIH